jgi:hypothetical protein
LTLERETRSPSPSRCWANRPPWAVETALKILATVCLAFLAWQGKEILRRLDTLERNQTRIFVALGVPPVAADTLEKRVKTPLFATDRRIKEIKPGAIP